MLKFQTNNDFDAKKSTGFNALKTKLIPFQFSTNIQAHIVTGFYLINGNNVINLSYDVDLIDILYDGQQYFYIFKGETNLITNLKCGIWQIKIIISNQYSYYSNFFNIIENYTHKFTYANSFDFDKKIYQFGYENIIYIQSKIVSDNFFKIEKIIEKGDGSKKYEYQNFAESFKFTIYGDEFVVSELGKLPMFDIVKFDDKQIFDRAIFEFAFDTKILNYKGTVKFSIDEVDKTLCETSGSYSPVGNTKIVRTTDNGTTIRTTNDNSILRKTN